MAYQFDPSIIARLLQGVGPALSAYGAGNPNFGSVGAQAFSDFDRQRQEAARDKLQTDIAQNTLAQQQKAQAEAERIKQAQMSAFNRLLPPVASPVQGGPMGGAGPAPAPANPMLAGMSPEQIAFLRDYGPADYGGALSMIGAQAFKDRERKNIQVSGGMQFDPNQPELGWHAIPGYTDQARAIAEAGRAPVQPPTPPSDFILWQEDRKNDPTNPNFKTIADWRKYQQATPRQPGIVTLFDATGNRKAFYEGDPNIKGMLDQGWTDKAPAAPPELKARALGAGLVEGTPEYQQFMMTGGKVPEGPGGVYGGTGIDQQDSNIILRGQTDESYRSTPEYALAWHRQYQQPKIITTPDPSDPTRMMQQQLLIPPPPGYLPPSMGGAATPQPATPAAQPAAASPATPAQAPSPAPTQPAPSAAPQTPTITPIPGTSKADPQDARKLKQIRAEVGGLVTSLDDFEKAVDSANMRDSLNAAVTGGTSKGGADIVSAWTVAAMQSKAESLFNLGVLNGPDMAVISGALINPATAKGAVATKDAYKAGIARVKKLIQDKLTSFEQQYGNGASPNSAAPNSNLFDKYGLTPPPGAPQ
jgi:hypothetical protein